MTPLPNNFTAGDGLNTAGYTFVAPENEKQMDFVAKIDHTFNAQHSAFARYFQGLSEHAVRLGQRRPAAVSRSPLLRRHRPRSRTTGPVTGAGARRGNLVNEFVVGQNHFTFDFVNPSVDASPSALLRFTASPQEHASRKTSRVATCGAIDTFQIVDNLSWLKGSHSFKFGTNMRFQRHTDIRGSVAGANVSPTVDFSTTVNERRSSDVRHPDEHPDRERPAGPRRNINFLLGRVGSTQTELRPAGERLCARAARCSISTRTTRRSISTSRTPGSRRRNSRSTPASGGKRS